MTAGRSGFTLVETLIALVLSSLVIVLVSTTFLVQNRYQASQVVRAAAQDNVRAATDLVARELRSSMRGGIVTAGARTLTVRSPVVLSSVCGRTGFFGNNADIHVDGGIGAVDTGEIAGVARFDAGSGTWTYQYADWPFLNGGGGGSAVRCHQNGADTTGARDDFRAVRRLVLLFGFGGAPEVGDLVMLFRETTFSIRPSALMPSTLALFRQPRGADPVEFASGIDTTAMFRYRLDGATTYQDTVPSGSVGQVDAVGLVVDTRRRSDAAPDEDVTFGWSTNLLLRNAP